MMLEGLHPQNPTHVMRYAGPQKSARQIADLIVETFDPAETASAAFENEAEQRWEVEVYFAFTPDEAAMRDLVRSAAGDQAAQDIRFETLAEQDWVKASLDGLSMVEAGRFLIHGGHDRHRVPLNRIGIEIEAALAFGTGHHGTTRGCLLMLDHLLKARRPKKVLDVGTGTGVLAMAAARSIHKRVFAGDIDPVAVRAARGNATLNRCGAYLRPVTAPGLSHPDLRGQRSYDVIFANILARPLRRLAPSLARSATGSADVILSGLLFQDVAGVLSAYAAQGFRLAGRINLEGWACLRLRRGGIAPRRKRR